MGQIVTLTESELAQIVGRVINEQQEDRVVPGRNITKLRIQIYSEQGLTPYYFDSKEYGKYKMVEVTGPLPSNMDRVRIFLLKPKESETINKIINNTNEIILLELKKIDLLTKYITSVLVDKIMRD